MLSRIPNLGIHDFFFLKKFLFSFKGAAKCLFICDKKQFSNIFDLNRKKKQKKISWKKVVKTCYEYLKSTEFFISGLMKIQCSPVDCWVELSFGCHQSNPNYYYSSIQTQWGQNLSKVTFKLVLIQILKEMSIDNFLLRIIFQTLVYD